MFGLSKYSSACFHPWLVLWCTFESICFSLLLLFYFILIEHYCYRWERNIEFLAPSDHSTLSDTGLSFVEDRLVYLFTATAYTTTMLDRICLVSCKHHSSLGTWLASAMGFSSCLGL